MTIEGIVYLLDGGTYRFSINAKLYTETAIFKACYVFIDKCYLYLDYKDKDHIEVLIKSKKKQSMGDEFVGEFFNELINQKLRVDINRESGKIRELLVAKSLFEGALIEEPSITLDSDSDDDYLSDPKNIGDLKGVK